MLPEGSVLADRYVIEAPLGDGGMGSVYRARHMKFGRTFAVKVLHQSLAHKPKVLQRFEREAELAGRLRHTNVAAVVDVGVTDEDIHFMAMELAPGTSLSRLLQDDGPMAESRVLDLAKQLCAGLSHAHDMGLIHRDFKPENVIVEAMPGGREVARIVDWGIAILRDDAAADVDTDRRLTTRGIVVGTPHYMAPEQARGDAIDHRVDLFALGLLCYELLTGKLPFDGTGVEVARANLEAPLPAMKERAPEITIDPVLEGIVRRLLEKDPERRPPSADWARELFELYERDRESCAIALGLAGDVEPAPLEAPDPERDRPTEHVAAIASSRRRARVVAIATLAVLAVVLGLVLGVALRDDVPPSRPSAGGQQSAIIATRKRPAPLPQTRDSEVIGMQAAPEEMPRSTPEVIAAERAALPPVKKHVASTPALAQPVPPAVVPSAADIAQRYAAVGRELQALEDARGMDATIDLWPRYRWIRINDWLATPERRAQVAGLLERLHSDVRAGR